MDRDTPHRSFGAARRARPALMASVLAALVLLVASPAGAQSPGPDDGEAVNLARAGAEAAEQSWIDAGLMVPALLALILAMIVGGFVMVLQRCRTAPVDRGR